VHYSGGRTFFSHFQMLYDAANAADLSQSSRCEAPEDIRGDFCPDLGNIKGPQSNHPVHSESTCRGVLITLSEHFSLDEISGIIRELGFGKSTLDMLFPELFKCA
jgi:hypothetical protein